VVVIDSLVVQLLMCDEVAERSVVSVFERVIVRVAGDGASDIHFERWQDEFHIRFCVDGTFCEIAVFLFALVLVVVACVKVLLGMDIVEHWLP